MSTTGFNSTALVAFLEGQFGKSFSFIHGTANEPIEGGEYAVFALSDAANCSRIAVRVPKVLDPFTSMRVQSELDIRRRIDTARLKGFQPLLACDTTAKNDLHSPFMVVGWAEGRPLRWSEDIPELEACRRSVLQDIANISLDLLQIHESGMQLRDDLVNGLTWTEGIPALDWITERIDRKIARARANNFPQGTVSECVKQKSLTREYWIPHLDEAPHVLVHGDLSSNNIIVDDDSKVTSVIDLGWAKLVPLQFAAEFPRFLVHEPVPNQSGFSWIRGKSTQLRKDREFYLQCIKDRAEREGGLALSYYTVLSRKDEVNRYWWYTAAGRADAHRAMSSCDWDPMSEINRAETIM